MRLQFRVWDKIQKKMLYDDFIIRHGNDSWTQEDYDKYNEIWLKANPEEKPLKRQEYSHCHAEPIETPETSEKNNALTEIMEPGNVSGASWSLIDWSNFRFENWITMQCTGFHDRYGKLIWEADLLEKDGIVDSVEKYYGHWVWNGQVITDFRDFDRYGNEITGQVDGPVTIQVDGQVADGVISLGYQGDTWGLETKNLVKVGHKFE